MKSKQQSAVQHRLVGNLTWCIQCPQTGATFVLYLQDYGSYFQVIYGRLQTKILNEEYVRFPFPVWESEIYSVKISLHPSRVESFAQELLKTIVSGDPSNPKTLPYSLGGEYRHTSPVIYIPSGLH